MLLSLDGLQAMRIKITVEMREFRKERKDGGRMPQWNGGAGGGSRYRENPEMQALSKHSEISSQSTKPLKTPTERQTFFPEIPREGKRSSTPTRIQTFFNPPREYQEILTENTNFFNVYHYNPSPNYLFSFQNYFCGIIS